MGTITGDGIAKITVAASAPGSPTAGDMWVDSDAVIASDYIRIASLTELQALITADETCSVLIADDIIGSGTLSIPAKIDIAGFLNGCMFQDFTSVTIGKMSYHGLNQITNCPLIFGAGAVSEVFVQWFGAKGDGITDDTTALARAIASGNRIRFIAGTYYITSTLFVPSVAGSAKQLIGDGSAVTAIEYHPTEWDVMNFGVWFGNHTEDVPSPVLSCINAAMKGVSINCMPEAAGALRCREILSSNFEDLRLGPVTGEHMAADTNTFYSLYIDGCVNSKFDLIDCLPIEGYDHGDRLTTAAALMQSMNLNRSAGSGSGVAITSTSFNNCWFHYARTGLYASTVSGVQLNGCIFETCWFGVWRVGDGLPLFINNGYWENINDYPIYLYGTSISTTSSVVVNGGYWNAADKRGMADEGGYVADTFVGGNYYGTMKIKDLFISSYYGIRAMFNNYYQTGKMEIQASNLEPKHNPLSDINDLGVHDVTTTEGSALVRIEHTNHASVEQVIGGIGYPLIVANAVIALRGHPSPTSFQNVLEINQPFYRITSIDGPDHYYVQSLWAPYSKADATETREHSAGEVLVYPGSCWINCFIPYADKTFLSDCVYQELVFQETFAGSGASVDLKYGNAGEIRSVTINEWFYIMKVSLHRDVIGGTISPAYLALSFPSSTGYDRGRFMGLTSFSDVVDSRNYDVDLNPCGFKCPPGTKIHVEIAPGAASTLQARVLIAKTGIKG